MNVVVLINGREAIPVRAIPRMADSTVSADILVRGLLCTKDDNPFHNLSAYELLEYECSRKVAAVEWRPAAVKLHALSDALHRRELKGELTHAEATAEWKRESVKRLPPGVFVWKDEFFRKHFERYRRLSNEELAQLHRDGLEMLRELASAPDDSYTAELMAAHGVPENWRETFQAEIDQANAEEPFNPGDYCLYVPNTCAPKETDTLSDATFSPLIEEDERFVVMEGFEHMPKAGPKNEEEQSGLVKAGEAVQILAKWLENPIDELPSYPRKIAQIYVPRWTEMSANERRAQAEEADHQVQATLGDRFEKARMDAEQTNAATPARFARRAMQDGFDKVTREKSGERNFEAKVAAANLTDARCIELAHSHELRIADWTALTGIGVGVHWSHVVSAEGVAFRKWTEGEISEASVDRQIEMHQDNEAVPLKFPCTPARLIQFVDAAPPGSHNFAVPEAFRRAVLDSERSTDVAAEAIQQVSQDQGWKSSEANPEHEVWAKTPEESGDTGTPVSSEVARRNRQEHDITAERGCRRIILEHWDTIERLHGPRAKGLQVQRFLRNQTDNPESELSLKTIQNRLIDLRKQKLIP